MATVDINFGDTKRHCGGCTLCCRLLPMHSGDVGMPGSIHKPAGERCPHQHTGKGCGIYSSRPACCRFWSCQWLLGTDTADLRRPDRSRYVIDAMPDFIEMRPHDGSPSANIRVVQVWVDPKHPDAWRDPALLAFLERRGEEGIAAIIRFNERDAITVFPPTLSADGQWHEMKSNRLRKPHSFGEIINALESAQRVIVEGSK